MISPDALHPEDRGLYPSWDAQDMRSLTLAEKLGYRPAWPYPVIWVAGVR